MIVTQTPLRISLAGGGTDFPEFFEEHCGCVVSSAIDKFVYCMVNERFDNRISLSYSKREIVDSVDEIEHELVREAMRKVGIQRGIEIAFVADVPAEGTGLGSSSSVTVGVLNALYHLIGETPSAERLAREAWEIEVDIVGKPIGVQDQYIAAYGGLRCLLFGPRRQVRAERVRVPRLTLNDLENTLMLFFTGRTRPAARILTEQKANIADNLETLLQMAAQARSARQLLESGSIEGLGALLHEGWTAKRRLASGVSDAELDLAYERALRAGAVGGKILGAGGGGFFLLSVPGEKRQALREALAEYREVPFAFERGGSRVVFDSVRY
jgi:D-glycero-alpha-D-manno-heptose-7-phosphate kinase